MRDGQREVDKQIDRESYTQKQRDRREKWIDRVRQMIDKGRERERMINRENKK